MTKLFCILAALVSFSAFANEAPKADAAKDEKAAAATTTEAAAPAAEAAKEAK